MQGRITEIQLPMAEKSFPGIAKLYRSLSDKSLTFLQLVWMYEEAREKACEASGEPAHVDDDPVISLVSGESTVHCAS